MYKQILHTPEGVRDIYNGECRRKQYIQETLHQVLTGYGYEDIQTPTFEYFVYSAGRLEPFRPGNFINSLTEKEIRWFFGRM